MAAIRRILATACIALLAMPGTVAAIPSPELIVGSLSSLSQIGALLAATIGGGAVFAGARGGTEAKAARRGWYAAAVFGLACAGLLAALFVTIASHQAERQTRLEANLLRPARQPGQQLADPTLKELSYADQRRHPLGITTDAAARLLSELDANPDNLIVDARTDAEVEMGGLPAKRSIRLSDFNAADPAVIGKKVLFYCHNGNRSYESCEAARAKGVDCRFIVGGLEKWVVERRPMTGSLRDRTLGQLRAIPDYPNKSRLLDTAEVKDLTANRAAQFIDVRYPGEFAVQHIAGAINIPMRRMTRQQLAGALASLPKRPVILPCYDRRSCFFAEVMGLELTRTGHAIAGRYTVPHEYFLSTSRPPHVEAWIAEANKTYWQSAREGLAAILSKTAASVGLPATIALLALLSRLLILPFAIKSERDQLIARATESEVATLKTALADDPARLRRALLDHAAAHGLTPLRNLLAMLLLPLMALSVLAVGDAAAERPAPFLWLDTLAAPDPTIALPLAFALILTIYCIEAFARTRRQATAIALVGLPLLAAIAVSLPAAAALYLSCSAILLVVQRLWVIGAPRRALAALSTWRAEQRERRLAGAVLLNRPVNPSLVGNKAARLATLHAAGLPVPPALVLDPTALATFLAAPVAQRGRLAKRYAAALGGKRFAVRSSATAEDGAQASFAGVFESVLNVGIADIPAAVERVAASFTAARVANYAVDGGRGNVIVQRMIDAERAGVMFTRAPDAPGQMLVEYVEGTGDDLVSGRRTPSTFRFGRLSQAAIGHQPPQGFQELLSLGHRIASGFGKPQDIEWAAARGRYYILQSRDISAEMVDRDLARSVEAHLARFAGSVPQAPTATILHAPTMMELLPRPSTSSLGLLNELWAPGGSVDLACRQLGLTYAARENDPSLYTRVNGRLMVDTAMEARRSVKLSSRQRRLLAAKAAEIASDLRLHVLPRLRDQLTLTAAMDLTRLTFADLQRHWRSERHRFVRETHTHAEIVNILAALVASTGASENVTTRASWQNDLVAAKRLTERQRTETWQHIAGHRANLDYELAHPRWSEVPGAVEAYVASLKLNSAVERSNPGSASDIAALKEDAKHEALRGIAVLRAILLELDRRLGLGGHIFELSLGEVDSATLDQCHHLQVTTRERRLTQSRLLQEPPPPSRLRVADLEALGTAGFASQRQALTTASGDGQCKGRGSRVAGRTDISGRAFVASHEQAETGVPLDGFRDGDILVAPIIHPDWLGIVLRAGGVVAETGGWLSHMAIVAREHGVAMIVGVPNAGQIRTGDRLNLLADGRIMAEPAPRLALVAAK